MNGPLVAPTPAQKSGPGNSVTGAAFGSTFAGMSDNSAKSGSQIHEEKRHGGNPLENKEKLADIAGSRAAT